MKNKFLLIALVVLVPIVVVGIVAFIILRMSANMSASELAMAGEYATSSTTPVGFLPFSNQQYHFSLYYPPDLVSTGQQEQGGAYTFSFQDADTNEGFEIYVTPYGDSQVSAARFKLDEPSGKMDQPTPVVIDGATATMFFGHNDVMGDTREVWFIKNGYLYEVTSFKELDSWLGTIMQTWRFI
ncbi:MAG TPA: hypothetical protein VMR46_03570 [Candidatus Paceibacterota bacterium]|nr:hypothetical protein [Candidatus Paceibacterota bacterium]